jgi:ABC-2 type transport system ATP-binding protein
VADFDPTPVVNVESLVKRYPGLSRPALDGISLRVHAGEFYGILGPNGAGKTTLMSTLCGWLRPDDGSVRVLDEPMPRRARRVRRRIGLVPQETALLESLTVLENCALFGRLYGLGGLRLRERAATVLDWVGLERRADDRVSSLSGGMKRLLNLALGLLHEPALLILDEPTVGVDVHTRRRVHDMLRAIHRAGACVMYTSHYLDEVQKLCTRVAILDHGRIVAEGSPDELLAGGQAGKNLEEVFVRLTESGE